MTAMSLFCGVLCGVGGRPRSRILRDGGRADRLCDGNGDDPSLLPGRFLWVQSAFPTQER